MHQTPRFASPLSPQTFHILLALADKPRHGYAIIVQVTEDSGGSVILSSGTAYSALDRLIREKWVEETFVLARQEAGKRRRYYKLTQLGERHLKMEIGRLKRAVAVGHHKLYGVASFE